MSDASFELFQFDAYLFDIDGTLANTRGGVHYNSFHTALRVIYGCDGRIDDVPVHGNTDPGILRAALERHGRLPADFEAGLPAARDLMCAEVAGKAGEMDVEVCPAIPELLAELHRRGKAIGVVTGNFETIGWLKLERGGIRHFFDFGSFSDTREKREDIFRHGIELARNLRGPEATVCVVGDTPNDIWAAAKVGIPVIAVATGIYSREELQKEGPTVCVTTCAELLRGSGAEEPLDVCRP
jgi:phosphoglycolate phosphatase-like HAD superfamily hydrolase